MRPCLEWAVHGSNAATWSSATARASRARAVNASESLPDVGYVRVDGRLRHR
jgi:hypothetical protein